MNNQELFKIFKSFSFELEKVLLLFKSIKTKFLVFSRSQPQLKKSKSFQKLIQELSKKRQILKQLYMSYKILKNTMRSEYDLLSKIDTIEKMFQKYGWLKQQEIKSYFQAMTISLFKIAKKLDYLLDSFDMHPFVTSNVESNLSSQFIRFVSIC